MKKKLLTSRFRAGSYSAVAAIIMICIAVALNLVVGALPESKTQLDLTASSLYSISAQTRQIVSALNKDVNLYLLSTTGSEDETITRLLDRYAEISSHIKVSYVDPAVQPTFLNNYELTQSKLYANSVLVECGSKYRLVSYTDIYVTTYSYTSYYSYNYTSTTEFDGENALTNAIHYVSSETLPKVYVLSGHGEEEFSSSITEMFEQDNIDYETLSLLSLESVPEDAQAVLINAPQTDLSDDERDLLIAYLQNGGCIILNTDYIEKDTMTNLLQVTQSMNLTVGDGLIMEGDSQKHLSRYPYYILPDATSHEITDDLIDSGYYILQCLCQPIEETSSTSATVTFLLTTSSQAYGKTAGMNATTTEKEDSDTAGPFNTGAISEYNDGKLIWFTGSDMLNDSIDRMVSGGNSNLFLNAVNYCCDQEESISIRAKSMDTETLTLSDTQNSFWSIMLVGFIPLAFIAAGVIIIIWRKRR